MSKKCLTYHLNSRLRINYVCDKWQLFASENNAGYLDNESVLNKPLSEFIVDRKSLHLYEMLIARVKKEQRSVKFPFRCDSPEKRRYMEMEIYSVDDGSVGFKSCIIAEEPREPVQLLETEVDRSEEIVTICSWCKKIKVAEDLWDEVENAIKKLELFAMTLLPQLSHGMCPVCYENMQGEL